MSKLPISISHREDKHKNIMMISCIIGNKCNFKCSYCPSQLNSGSADWLSKEAILNLVDRIIDHYSSMGKTLYFEFSGGEVTCNKEFLDIVLGLKERGCWVGIISNGGRSMDYWEKLIPHLDHVCLSYHPAFSKREKFVELVNKLYERVTTHVNIVMQQEYFDECCEIGLEISKSIKNSSLSFQPVMKTLGVDSELMDYTQEQLDRLKYLEETVKIVWEKEVKTYRGMLKRGFDDGTEEDISATALFAEEATGFSGWKCWAGIELLSIFYNGDIYPCWGFEGVKKGRIGNIHDEVINFPDKPCTCAVDTCFDICDIMTTRKRCN